MNLQLTEREALVLRMLVERYLHHAEPVGSQALAEDLLAQGITLSSASVRSTLGTLSSAGFLEQPHTSAGRIPTRDGLTVYVRHLMQPKTLSNGEVMAIQNHLSSQTGDLVTVLRETSRLLSQLSQYAAVVMTPRTEVVRIKHIEFVQLSARRVLGVLVAQNGTVFNRPMDADSQMTLSDLERMTNYCNMFFFGLTIEEAIEKAHTEMREASRAYDEILGRALAMSTQVLECSAGNEVIIDAPWGVLDQHASMPMLQVRRRLAILQEKTRLVQVMQQFQEAGKAHVAVGCDDPQDPLHECGMVTAPYSEGKTVLGCIGVLGPTRMDYSRVVPMVESAAQYIGEWLTGK